MKLQQVLSYVRRAIDDYHMIEDGDKIAVGISGGKDSLTLLYALNSLRIFYPKKFDLYAITVDMGFDGMDFSRFCAYFRRKRAVEPRLGRDGIPVRRETGRLVLSFRYLHGLPTGKLQQNARIRV